jgi:hypothetical protein
LLSIALVPNAPFPFVFVLLLWLCALIVGAWRASTPMRRAIAINLAAAIGLFLVLEAHWVNKKVFRQQLDIVVEHEGEFRLRDPLLGHRLVPNYSGLARRTVNGELSYEVTYTTDSEGYRISPAPAGQGARQCIVFMGCSFTFGDGVEDSETMPYQLSRLLNRKGFNIAVSGYGPHHMLAAIENDRLPDMSGCDSTLALYQAIPDHVKRSAGIGKIAEIGPRYVLEDGRASYAGQFQDAAKNDPTASLWGRLFGRSYIFQEYFVDRHWIGDYEIDLFMAIVGKSAKLFKAKHPGSRFVVLHWDSSDRTHTKAMTRSLPELSDDFIRITEIISDVNDNAAEWRLHHDPHPNAKAHRKIAEYLADRLGTP